MKTPRQIYDIDPEFRKWVHRFTGLIVDRKTSPTLLLYAAQLAGEFHREYVDEALARNVTLREELAFIRALHRERCRRDT